MNNRVAIARHPALVLLTVALLIVIINALFGSCSSDDESADGISYVLLESCDNPQTVLEFERASSVTVFEYKQHEYMVSHGGKSAPTHTESCQCKNKEPSCEE